MSGFFYYTIILSFLIGVIVRSVGGFSSIISSELGLLISAMGVVLLIGLSLVSRQRKTLAGVFLGLIILGFGIIRTDRWYEQRQPDRLDQFVDEHVQIFGRLVTDPDERMSNARLVIESNLVISESSFELVDDTKIVVSTTPYPEFQFGDIVSVSGKIKSPENFATEAGREFDYVNFLGKDDIFYTTSFAEVELLEPGRSSVKRKLFALKNSLVKSINQRLPEPQAGLLNGELLGEKSGLSPKRQDQFRRTGVIHVVVLSGYNVTLVADFLIRVVSVFFSGSISLIVGVLGIVGFAILTGAGATIVRASLMAVLVIIARVTGRPYQIGRALWLAALVMVLHNPTILLYDISFQLSFLATVGLIYVVPRIEKYFAWVTNWLQMREHLLATLATQIAVLPLLLFSIGELSIISPVANILVLVAVPYAMLSGFLMSVGNMLWSMFGIILSTPAYYLLAYQTTIVEILAALPFASIIVPPFPWWVVGVVYGVMVVWLMRGRGKVDKKF